MVACGSKHTSPNNTSISESESERVTLLTEDIASILLSRLKEGLQYKAELQVMLSYKVYLIHAFLED